MPAGSWSLLLLSLVSPAILAGCTDAANPPANPPNPVSVLPPSLLVDRSREGTLHLYVHAKQGNVRYDFINITLDNETRLDHHARYAAEAVLDRAEAHVRIQVVEGRQEYAWAAGFALNETAIPPRLIVTPNLEGEPGETREVAIPYEKLLPRLEEEAES